MNHPVTHHCLDFLLLFCIANFCIVRAFNETRTFSTATELPTTSAPVTHFPGVSHTVPPTEVPGTSTFTGMQQVSTVEHNSSRIWRNNSEVTTVANLTGLSSSSVSAFPTSSWRKPDNISYGSTDFTRGKSSSPLASTAWTTHQPTGVRNETNLTVPPATNEYPTKTANNTDRTRPNINTYNGTYTTTIYAGQVKLKHPEAILTIAFSVLLFTVVLVILIYSLNKCKTRRRQYAHRPLDDTSYDSVDHYSTPEDTLVISGGLYDSQRVYNPTMTVLEDEECQHDYLSFSSKPGQFRLEFLPGEKETESAVNDASFNSFHLPNHSL